MTEAVFFKNVYRDDMNCNVSSEFIGKKVILSGWVGKKRNHGGILFVDLRDASGLLQIVFHDKTQDFDQASQINLESVIRIEGNIVKRSESTINPKIENGDVEVCVNKWSLISECNTLPFPISDDTFYPEDILSRYRFLDLRRQRNRRNIIFRSKIINHMRNLMISSGFYEFNTPILTASSPEGARDYLVPSRVHNGKFYALPQAPQIFKQLLMVAGFERYFQIAPCFRDEDARADRSPAEFYQLDIEMSFVEQEDVLRVAEEVIIDVFEKYSNSSLMHSKMPRIPYKECMLKYGTDKPDLRNPITIHDATDIFKSSGIEVYVKGIKQGMVVRAVPVPQGASMSRKFFDHKIDFVKEYGGSGLGYLIFDDNVSVRGSLAKFFDDFSEIKTSFNLNQGDAVMFYCDYVQKAAMVSGKLRNIVGQEMNLIDDNLFSLCWVLDFPYFAFGAEGEIDFSHNPFSMPQSSLDGEISNILAYQFDVVCNGVEIASGAIRNHKVDIMKQAFQIVGYDESHIQQTFGGLLRAFEFGAPPHGGLAFGIERIIMLLRGEENIRSVLCFPMNQSSQDLLLGAPSEVSDDTLEELGIQIKSKK